MRPASSTVTDTPRVASSSAADKPVNPPPITTTSARPSTGPWAPSLNTGAVSSQYESSFIYFSIECGAASLLLLLPHERHDSRDRTLCDQASSGRPPYMFGERKAHHGAGRNRAQPLQPLVVCV